MLPLFILTRAIHIGACLLFFATFAFDRFVAVTVTQKTGMQTDWRRGLRWSIGILLPVILISGIAWFVLVSTSMSGEAFGLATLKTVWFDTQFGTLSAIRLLLWFASTILALLPLRSLLMQKSAIQLVLSACLLGSLAWAGHGRESSDWHLAADILHLLAAGLWPTGLLPFALLLTRLRRNPEPEKWPAIATLVQRFSAISLGTVVLLAGTGVVNSYYLLDSISDMVAQPYGRWLSAKLLLFLIAAGIGAVNLRRLKPRLLQTDLPLESAHSPAAQLQINVFLELVLGTVIVLIVAILGILPP